MRDHVLHAMPYAVRVLVGILIYRKNVAMLHGQGTGRYTDDEVAGFRAEIWQRINEMLVASRSAAASASGSEERRPFWALGGEAPTEADATLFGFIVSVLLCTAGPDSQKLVRGLPAVMDYAERIQDTYFPDYEKWSA